jgi:PAT family beta-lactamase induction signal transducer AmpG
MNMLSALPALSEHRRLRLWAFFLLYITQGIPVGLLMVAIPAWLAANGASAAQVGTFIGIAFLPWSLKLANGLLMDRFCYRPMGRMRAWIIGSQAMMIVTLLVIAVLAPGAADITLLAVLGFALNLCATFNDVAVDGMAVDLVPGEERERTAAFMGGGQAVGISGTAALSGFMLASGGIAMAAIACAVLVSLLTVVVTLLRERPQERFLPWTAGTASPECLAGGQDALLPIIGKVLRGLFAWRTLLFLAGAGMITSTAGMADVFGPSFSVSELGWSSEYYSSYLSISIALIAISVMALMGPLISRFGAARVFTLFTSLLIVTNLSAYFSLSGYFGPDHFGTLAMQVWIFLYWGAFVGSAMLIIAWTMNLTNPVVAASQFALFMAIPNLVRSFGAGAHGQLIDSYGYGAAFLVAAISIALGMTICLLAGLGRMETAAIRDSAKDDTGIAPQPYETTAAAQG